MIAARRVGAALAAACLLSVGGSALGYETRGARPCAGWQQFRLDERADNPLSAEIYETWLVGYLSGLVAGSGIDFLAGTPNQTVFGLVDIYCDNHAEMNLGTAGLSVARTLLEQKGLSSPPNWP